MTPRQIETVKKIYDLPGRRWERREYYTSRLGHEVEEMRQTDFGAMLNEALVLRACIDINDARRAQLTLPGVLP